MTSGRVGERDSNVLVELSMMEVEKLEVDFERHQRELREEEGTG